MIMRTWRIWHRWGSLRERGLFSLEKRQFGGILLLSTGKADRNQSQTLPRGGQSQDNS